MWHRPHLLNAIADLLILAAIAALVAAAAIWLARVPSLPVREVVFTNQLLHTSPQEIEQVLPAAMKGNFFSLNLNAVRGVLETLPWVRRVHIRRSWPAKLEISIEEHQAAARWGEGHGELVNTYGEVFTGAFPDEGRLPLLSGPVGTSHEVLKQFSEMENVFRKVHEKPVQLSLSPRLAWEVKLENGMFLNLGREHSGAPLNKRLERFISVYPAVLARQQGVRPKKVDLRYPNGFAMWVEGNGKEN